MATKTITTCDMCKSEIKEGGRTIFFSAARFDAAYTVLAHVEQGEFCSDACVINVVRGLLNGRA